MNNCGWKVGVLLSPSFSLASSPRNRGCGVYSHVVCFFFKPYPDDFTAFFCNVADFNLPAFMSGLKVGSARFGAFAFGFVGTLP
jgi:hypothetical protein